MDKLIIVITIVFIIFNLFAIHNLAHNSQESYYEIAEKCSVPKNPPYIWVKAVTKNAIVLGITDPNDPGQVTGYSVYYWGLRYGVNSTIDRRNRDFGQRNFSTKGPFVIERLKPKFIYCADITAFNSCGHGPFCVSCFENILTWPDAHLNFTNSIYSN
ncbi:uncharacterized protein LOC128385693 [Panonychus citri]|uniref:uncharacterized protein LOC128385693 n=1 Tax=Panonychus citri TaxID=50023 RepID=UPI002307F728|nr:uncharacterized protein LOC128385693 [Panonychus citri]